jgi:hypothetical protein
METHEITFMQVLHTLDQSWCEGNLKDNVPSFHNNFIWGHNDTDTYCEILMEKVLSPCNSCMLDEKQKKNINDFGWMNVDIAFGGSYVV